MEADGLYLREIGIREKHLGPDHPDLASSLTKRATLLATQVREVVGGGLFDVIAKGT